MVDDHGNHGEEHQHRVKNVQKYLVTDKVAIIALGEFDKSEDRSYEDQDTRDVKCHHYSLPGRRFPVYCRGLERHRGGLSVDPKMEDGRGDDKHTKEEELDGETDDGDGLAGIHSANGAGRHDAAA